MRHAAVVVTLAPTSLPTSDGLVKNFAKEKEVSEKAESKELNKESNSATHNLVPLEDEVLASFKRYHISSYIHFSLSTNNRVQY